MTNILIISEEYLLSTTFELNKIFKHIEKKSSSYARLLKQSAVTPTDFNWCDILITIRSNSLFDLELSRLAKKNGKLHILFLDDDLLGLSSNYGQYGVGIWPQRKKFLRDVLDYTDIILTSNSLLGKKYTSIGSVKEYVLINTAISPEDLVESKDKTPKDGKIKVVYYVNDGSSDMFERYIKPILPELSEKYGNRLSFTLMALKPDLTDVKCDMDINYIKHLDFKEFRNFLWREGFDIGIAPLVNGGFSQYKYFNKYIEYAIAGIPGIYSACSPYTYIIKDGVNGVLCGDSSADWYSALCKLIDDELIRERIKCNSKNQLKDEFAIEKIVNMLIKNYPKIITFKAPTSRCGVKIYWLQFCRKISIMQECCYFARLALQNGGVKLLLVRIYRYFYRLRKNSSTEKRLKKI